MNNTDEFWYWAPNAPVKIDCKDYDPPGSSGLMPYWPFGCLGCSHMDQTYSQITDCIYCCNIKHHTAHFEVRVLPLIDHVRSRFFVMYRTYGPEEKPTPIPANTIAGKVDEIATEAKPILPEKEKAYGNLFPGGSAEVARRIVEKAQRLTGKASDEHLDDTERDLFNYIAIHRACRERENKRSVK